MNPIIGLDFGNYNSYVCFLPDMNLDNRMSGMVQSLLPPANEHGIPSAYFYSQRIGRELFCDDALRARAIPLSNRLRYLKRHMGEMVTLDDRNIKYDDVITKVAEYCIREADKELYSRYLVHTNKVALAYPADYSPQQVEKLVSLIEKAILEDGKNVKVVGTIAEPAAAALDYLAEFSKKDATVITFDLGGGTFDLSLVAAYVNGRRNSIGKTIYYDVINSRGIKDLGGIDFTDIIFRILLSKINVNLSSNGRSRLHEASEEVKQTLSRENSWIVTIPYGEDFIDIEITRSEFENHPQTKELLKQMMDMTRDMLNNHVHQKIDYILLTGGASQMPMIKRTLEDEFPAYRGKIIFYRPDRAVAYGTARYAPNGEEVLQRINFDIGVRTYDKNDRMYIKTLFETGTEIPCNSETLITVPIKPVDRAIFKIFRAVKQNPDIYKWDSDYSELMELELLFEKKVGTDFKCGTDLSIDTKGIMTINSYTISDIHKKEIKKSITISN